MSFAASKNIEMLVHHLRILGQVVGRRASGTQCAGMRAYQARHPTCMARILDVGRFLHTEPASLVQNDVLPAALRMLRNINAE